MVTLILGLRLVITWYRVLSQSSESFGYDNGGLVTDGSDDRLLFTVPVSNVTLPFFDHEWFSKYANAYIVFKNNTNPIEMTLEFRYYVSSSSDFKFLFYIRCVRGIQRADFDHRIFNVKSTDFAGTMLYFEPLNMNGQKIVNLADPTGANGAATKGYVDTENSRQDIAINSKAEKTEVLLRNGGQSMTGNLNMNNRRIFPLPDPNGSQQPVTKRYLENEIAKIPQPDLNGYLATDGSRPMTGGLDMGDNRITHLETGNDVPVSDYPNYLKDAKMAVNKEYVNKNFLKIQGDDYDLRCKRILNTEPHYDGVFSDNDLVSKAFVDAEIAKLPKPDLQVLGPVYMERG